MHLNAREMKYRCEVINGTKNATKIKLCANSSECVRRACYVMPFTHRA